MLLHLVVLPSKNFQLDRGKLDKELARNEDMCVLSLKSNTIKIWCTNLEIVGQKLYELIGSKVISEHSLKSNDYTKIWCIVTSKQYALYHLIVYLFAKFPQPHSMKIVALSRNQDMSEKSLNQRTNGPVAHLRLFALSKLMVTFLKNETYRYGSRFSLKNLWSLYPTVTWHGI